MGMTMEHKADTGAHKFPTDCRGVFYAVMIPTLILR